MKNTKTPVSVLMKQGKSHGPIVSSKHQEIETPGANNEEIDTPTEVVIVDFASQVCQQKTMARELPKFTKNESPFYLNCKSKFSSEFIIDLSTFQSKLDLFTSGLDFPRSPFSRDKKSQRET